mgnify:CR=1 FL=1
MKIGHTDFDTRHHTYVMGILNVTPDSFSDGGRWSGREAALAHARQMVQEGADILDIGGESTRPGFRSVPAGEELARILPVIEAVRAELDIPISVDTRKSEVARAALAAGADLINDVDGLEDPGMAAVIADSGSACCLMHHRQLSRAETAGADVCAGLAEILDRALQAGIARERIILDPGIGFGKSPEINLKLLQQLDCASPLGCPLLLGASRKSVIGLTLNLPSTDRLEGTLVTTVLAVQAGYGFVRVHDVRENSRVIRMMEAIREA